MEIKQWLSSRALSAAALENLYGINRSFLDTVAMSASCRDVHCETSPLSERIAAGVAGLSRERRREFAHCPFSLFDASFCDGAFWMQIANTVCEPSTQDVDGGDIRGMKRFSQLALFYAWHLARFDPLAARVLLGMSERTQAVFSQLSLPHLQQLALSETARVVPRWSNRATVWQILLGAAHLGPDHLAEIRMFGIQLIAGDLAAASG